MMGIALAAIILIAFLPELVEMAKDGWEGY